ncbi:MAG: HAMP domain-containing histidine kinase [Lachnospiraceae bacterium]|nr:HAMP domain-containing histidine kinase [Lachnospiraceae bacterium]
MKRKNNKKSIFSRLVGSYVLFLFGTIFLYVVLAILIISYLGNGSVENASPQTVVTNEGTIRDLEVLSRIGGWVEELDEKGNLITSWGEKKTEKERYEIPELAQLCDLGYVQMGGSGVYLEQHEAGSDKEYTACIRYVGEPKRIFLVCYPSSAVSYKLTYMINNGVGKNTWIFFAAFGLLFLAEVAGISLYLKKHIDKPLRQLMDGMDEVSEGKRDIVIDYDSDREFDEIRDRFNRMARKLKDSEEEKHRIEQGRNQMLLELAHDIKNPLASIKSCVGALQEGLVEEEKIRDQYRVIDSKAERIRMLTEDLNTSLKLENDEYRLAAEEADLCETVRQICAEFYEEITDAGKEFEIDIPEEPVPAVIDKKLFGRVIQNLLSNANKYNSTGKVISLSLHEDGDQTVIEVADDGEAIAEDFVPRMFDEFARGDTTRKTDGGTGLGLAIARKIVEKHGGVLKYIRAEEKNIFCIRMEGKKER